MQSALRWLRDEKNAVDTEETASGTVDQAAELEYFGSGADFP
jgi:hypothetical protein